MIQAKLFHIYIIIYIHIDDMSISYAYDVCLCMFAVLKKTPDLSQLSRKLSW